MNLIKRREATWDRACFNVEQKVIDPGRFVCDSFAATAAPPPPAPELRRAQVQTKNPTKLTRAESRSSISYFVAFLLPSPCIHVTMSIVGPHKAMPSTKPRYSRANCRVPLLEPVQQRFIAIVIAGNPKAWPTGNAP
mmetsp:Transcript_89113/g.177230  ORF Transcript_89113/g.177230 Transcript_89113/m.177230 type:complete len:137 (-) Transcript_89113:54-464(-)